MSYYVLYSIKLIKNKENFENLHSLLNNSLGPKSSQRDRNNICTSLPVILLTPFTWISYPNTSKKQKSVQKKKWEKDTRKFTTRSTSTTHEAINFWSRRHATPKTEPNPTPTFLNCPIFLLLLLLPNFWIARIPSLRLWSFRHQSHTLKALIIKILHISHSAHFRTPKTKWFKQTNGINWKFTKKGCNTNKTFLFYLFFLLWLTKWRFWSDPNGQKGAQTEIRKREPESKGRRGKRGCLRKMKSKASFSWSGQVGVFETEKLGRSGKRERVDEIDKDPQDSHLSIFPNIKSELLKINKFQLY